MSDDRLLFDYLALCRHVGEMYRHHQDGGDDGCEENECDWCRKALDLLPELEGTDE